MEGNENDERSPPVAVQTPPASPSSLKKHTVWSPTSAKALCIGEPHESSLLPPLDATQLVELLQVHGDGAGDAEAASVVLEAAAFAFGSPDKAATDAAPAFMFQSPTMTTTGVAPAATAAVAAAEAVAVGWEATFDFSALGKLLPQESEPGVRCIGPRDYRLRKPLPKPKPQPGTGKGKGLARRRGREGAAAASIGDGGVGGGEVHRAPGQEVGVGYTSMHGHGCCGGHGHEHGHEHDHEEIGAEAEDDDEVYSQRVSDATAALLARAAERRARQLAGEAVEDSEGEDEEDDGEVVEWIESEVSRLENARAGGGVRTFQSLEEELLGMMSAEERQTLRLALDDETIRASLQVGFEAEGAGEVGDEQKFDDGDELEDAEDDTALVAREEVWWMSPEQLLEAGADMASDAALAYFTDSDEGGEEGGRVAVGLPTVVEDP